MTLSICIPSIPSRFGRLINLMWELQQQVEALPEPKQVELLAFTDNKRRSIGMKRQALLEIAQGDYIAFIDDDDTVDGLYIQRLLEGCKQGSDVVTFNQMVYINGKGPHPLTFKLGHPVNEEPNLQGFTRPPWHVCAWKAEIAKACTFGDSNYGEDWVWAKQANTMATTSTHIDAYLCSYFYDDSVTEAHD